MSLLKDYIDWVRKQMKREETPVVVEQQVQPVIESVVKPKRTATRKKKVNLTVPNKE